MPLNIFVNNPMLEIYRLLLVLLSAWSALAQMDTITATGSHGDSQINNISISYEYRKIAAEILAKMKDETDPCDDFYQFACGNFIESVQIPEGKKLVDAYNHIPDMLTKQIKEIITEERPETDPNHFQLLNKFYKSCMNRPLIDSLLDEPVREISNSLGGWPVVVGDSWDSDNSWSWQDLAKKLRRRGFNTDYIMILYLDNMSTLSRTRNIINLHGPTMVFKSDFYNTSKKAYKHFMIDVAIRFGARKAAAIRELRKTLDFEKDLVHIFEPDRNIRYSSNLLSIHELQERYPYVQWLDFINGLLPEDLKIDDNITINLLTPNFFDELGPLLARTDKRTIANYIMWKFHYFAMKFLSKRFRNKRQQFDSRFLNIPLQKKRAKECEFIVFASLSISVSSLYVHKYFNRMSKATATKMFENIAKAFDRTLDESQWLDGETKVKAKRKLHSIKAVIGFADEVFDIGKVEDYYRELEIDENQYFRSYLNIRTFDLDKRFRRLRKNSNETEFFRYVTLSNRGPYHDLTRSVMHIPPTFLQGRMFNARHPNYMNFGFIGSTMAHEITHGFYGDSFKKFASPASLQALSERNKCFVEQYSNFTDKQTGLKINGSQTLEENVADNSGVKHSYLAYKKWQAKYGEEPKLPGLKYTPQQMYWISFAQSFCGKYTSDGMEYLIKKGIHSPHEFRVLGVLRNMKDFSEDFQCPENSPMNPMQKCVIW